MGWLPIKGWLVQVYSVDEQHFLGPSVDLKVLCALEIEEWVEDPTSAKTGLLRPRCIMIQDFSLFPNLLGQLRVLGNLIPTIQPNVHLENYCGEEIFQICLSQSEFS